MGSVGLGFRVPGLGFRVQGLGFRVQGLGLGVALPLFSETPKSRKEGKGQGFRA